MSLWPTFQAHHQYSDKVLPNLEKLPTALMYLSNFLAESITVLPYKPRRVTKCWHQTLTKVHQVLFASTTHLIMVIAKLKRDHPREWSVTSPIHTWHAHGVYKSHLMCWFIETSSNLDAIAWMFEVIPQRLIDTSGPVRLPSLTNVSLGGRKTIISNTKVPPQRHQKMSTWSALFGLGEFFKHLIDNKPKETFCLDK